MVGDGWVCPGYGWAGLGADIRLAWWGGEAHAWGASRCCAPVCWDNWLCVLVAGDQGLLFRLGRAVAGRGCFLGGAGRVPAGLS